MAALSVREEDEDRTESSSHRAIGEIDTSTPSPPPAPTTTTTAAVVGKMIIGEEAEEAPPPVEEEEGTSSCRRRSRLSLQDSRGPGTNSNIREATTSITARDAIRIALGEERTETTGNSISRCGRRRSCSCSESEGQHRHLRRRHRSSR